MKYSDQYINAYSEWIYKTGYCFLIILEIKY